MTELLSHWMPQPERAPAGLAGVLLLVAFLAASTYVSQMSVWTELGLAVAFIAGVMLCVASVARERSRLFGYLGISASVLYLFGLLTTSFLALLA
jgi:xanthine/uracil/vitamin C permease (AzgA family)